MNLNSYFEPVELRLRAHDVVSCSVSSLLLGHFVIALDTCLDCLFGKNFRSSGSVQIPGACGLIWIHFPSVFLAISECSFSKVLLEAFGHFLTYFFQNPAIGFKSQNGFFEKA